MASLTRLKYQNENVLSEVFSKKRIIELERKKERDAAVKIQSWFRTIQVQNAIKHQRECARIIQRTYRGYVGRKLFRKIVKENMERMMLLFYDQMAILIQANWRGYYIRKYIFNFYARKEYLKGLTFKNETIRLELEKARLESVAEEKARRLEQNMASTITQYRKQHHLLSTEVRRGVYNSPKNPNPLMETALRSVSPFSKEERNFLVHTKREDYLRTATGIPSASEQTMISTDRFQPLPPIATKVKPQGPFRSPEEVTRQRYKALKPTLRVATDFEPGENTRYKLREDEWTKRIIDKKFLPSMKLEFPYIPSLHATSSYKRSGYGTKHFRETGNSKLVQKSEFQRVISPIPLFDQLGKTY